MPQRSTEAAPPLPLIAERRPDAIQRLDRETGTISLSLRAIDEGGWSRTVLQVPPCPAGASLSQRQRQDEAIVLLDRFCFLPLADGRPLLDHAPPRISTDGVEIRLGFLPLVRWDGRAWITDSTNLSHARELLRSSDARMTARVVREWPRSPYPLPDEPRQVGHGGRLRLVVQLEDDPTTAEDASARVLRHPLSTVLIQADAFGGHRVVYGEAHLRGGLYRRQVKMELGGHGRREAGSDQPELSGYTSEGLAARLHALLDKLRFPLRIDQVNLTACALESPVFSRSFAAEFLTAAHERGLLLPEATVTAYASPIAFGLDRATGEKMQSRATLLAGRPEVHAPGQTIVYKRDRASGQVLCRDKYAGVDGGFRPLGPGVDGGSPWNDPLFAGASGPLGYFPR